MSTGHLSSRKISSTSSSHSEMTTRGWTTITNASRRACTRLYTGERVHTRAGNSGLSSSRRPRSRRRSSNPRRIQNKRSRRLCAIATGRATVLEDRRDVDGRPRLADRVTAHALWCTCGASRNHQDGKTARARTSACVVRLDLLMPLMSTTYPTWRSKGERSY